MTRIEELEQSIDEAVEKFRLEINKHKAEIEKIKKEVALAELKESKKEGKWLPKEREEYWFRDIRGNMVFFHYDTDHEGDRWRIDNLPIFPTKESCERYWHFMDTVKEKSYEFSREELEDTHIAKYFIKYDFDNKEFAVDGHRFTKVFNAPYFKTEEDAKYIIDNFKDKLMEYFV